MNKFLQRSLLAGMLLYASPTAAQTPTLTAGHMGEAYVGVQQEYVQELDDEHALTFGLIQRPAHDDILLELRLTKDVGFADFYLGNLNRVSWGLDSHKALYGAAGLEFTQELGDNTDLIGRIELDVGNTSYLHPQIGLSFRF